MHLHCTNATECKIAGTHLDEMMQLINPAIGFTFDARYTAYLCDLQRQRLILDREPSEAEKAALLAYSVEMQLRPGAEAHRHIAALDSLDKALEPRWDEIAYRDYAFTGTITTPETKVNVSEAYIRIADDGRFISMDNKLRGLRHGAGKAIPGYEEIFK